MKLVCFFLFASLLSTFARSEPAELALMTYNIRLDLASDGPNRWDERKHHLASQVAFLAPDVLGIQEGLVHQVAFLESELADYAYVGVGRDDADQAGEFSALFYRANRLTPTESSTFWLSETPDQPSFGWGASYRRICTYARFRDAETGSSFWVFNTHFDHETPVARLNGAKLILQRIDELVGDREACFLIGDLNATPGSPPIDLIASRMNDARAHCQGPVFGSEGTFNGFRPDVAPDRRIDYIFVSPREVDVLAYATFSELIDLRFPSDHFPVMIRARIIDGSAEQPSPQAPNPSPQ